MFLYFVPHLGTLGGARLGLEGTVGGGPPCGSGEAPGRDGTGGPPAGGGPGGGPREPGRAGGPGGALRFGVGLVAGDLPRETAGEERNGTKINAGDVTYD